ncbi:hypothetical protein LR48_Vigan03g093200 [Vigna angularis]|uniref:Uncharacterized protein n=2 Tax=Phaseolus angularis TaxID=3914 RepID=A0A0L9U439_PHAAN|nr:hypothetical protein LR48_Vigan03g093200 [Vigna angularis]BAT84126.1 hypothetical protein VIGAN_04140500 [Vigna angularis var. angularis]
MLCSCVGVAPLQAQRMCKSQVQAAGFSHLTASFSSPCSFRASYLRATSSSERAGLGALHQCPSACCVLLFAAVSCCQNTMNVVGRCGCVLDAPMGHLRVHLLVQDVLLLPALTHPALSFSFIIKSSTCWHHWTVDGCWSWSCCCPSNQQNRAHAAPILKLKSYFSEAAFLCIHGCFSALLQCAMSHPCLKKNRMRMC